MLCAGAVVYGPVLFLASLAPSFPSVPLFLSLLSLPLRGVVPWWVHPARVRGTYSSLSTVGLNWTGYIDCAGSMDHILIPSAHLFSYLVWGSGRRAVQRLKNAWGCGPVTAAERTGTLHDAAVTMTTSFTMHSLSQHSHARARCPVFLSLHGMGGVVVWCIHRRGLWLILSCVDS